jgi:hypothetical protein
MKRDLQKNEKRLVELDRMMALNLQAMQDLDGQMEASASAFSKLSELGAERSVIEKSSEKLEEEWLQVSEGLESMRKALKEIGR